MDWQYIVRTVAYVIICFAIWSIIYNIIRSFNLSTFNQILVYISVIVVMIYLQTKVLKSDTIAVVI